MFTVAIRAQGGLNINRLIHERHDLSIFTDIDKTVMIFLQIDENDLSEEQRSAEQVANDIYTSRMKIKCCHWIHIHEVCSTMTKVIQSNTKLLSFCQEGNFKCYILETAWFLD